MDFWDKSSKAFFQTRKALKATPRSKFLQSRGPRERFRENIESYQYLLRNVKLSRVSWILKYTFWSFYYGSEIFTREYRVSKLKICIWENDWHLTRLFSINSTSMVWNLRTIEMSFYFEKPCIWKHENTLGEKWFQRNLGYLAFIWRPSKKEGVM